MRSPPSSGQAAPPFRTVDCHPSRSSPRRSARSGQPERHVAKVDHEAAEAAGHVDREVTALARRGEPCRGSGIRRQRWRPAGRSRTSRPPASEVVAPAAVHAVELDLADGPAVSEAGGGHHRPERRQQVVGQVGEHLPALARVGDGAERGEQPRVIERVLRRARIGGGRRRARAPRMAPFVTAQGPPVATTRSAAGPLGPVGCPSVETAQGGSCGGHPERNAFAGRIGPRGDPQFPHPIAQSVAIRRPGRPGRDPVDDWSSGSSGASAADGTIARSSSASATALAGPRPDARPAIEPDLDDVDPPIQDLGEGHRRGTQRAACVVERQRRDRSGAPGVALRPVRPGPAPPTSDPCGLDRPRRRMRPAGSAIPPARITGISGRRCAAAGDECRRARLAPDARRPPADRPRRRGSPRRPDRGAERTSRAGRWSPRLPPTSASRFARRVATSGASARSDPATTASRGGRRLETSTHGRSVDRCPVEAERGRQGGIAAVARSTSSAARASRSAPAGSASDPISRQRPPTCPISAAAIVPRRCPR